jgi:hypothetical protein
MANTTATDDILALAAQLTPADKARLIAELANELAANAPVQQRKPLIGLAADLGPAPSAEDIEVSRREMVGDIE